MSDFVKPTEEKEKEIEEKPKTEGDDAEAGGDGEEGIIGEEESSATYKPVVVLETTDDVTTGEEDEEILYKQRCKLFVYGETMLDKGTGNKTWKERGIGDIRFLKHKETERIRVLMREEKTLKMKVNHFLDPRMKLVPNSGNDRSWVWIAMDFAELELTETTFAVRFSNSDIAQTFKEEFEKYQKEMERFITGIDAEDTTEGDAAAEEISKLSVGDKEKEDKGATETETETEKDEKKEE